MIMLLVLGLLVVLVGAVCWLAVETRRVHQALDAYATTIQQWQTMLAQVEYQRRKDNP
jgi:CHASE3 domain sensor protein